MLFREIIAVPSEIDTKHRDALVGQKVEYLNVTTGGRCISHVYLKEGS
jgi:hypothetical protein